MKILNLYAGIGGNRKLWKGTIDKQIYVTAKRQILRNCVSPELGLHILLTPTK